MISRNRFTATDPTRLDAASNASALNVQQTVVQMANK
jgi:hypothetical protein